MSPSSSARWYIAKLIEEIAVEDDPLKVIHRTVTVIYANSEQEAYERAILLGKEREIIYRNPGDKLVRTIFWGLGELNVVSESPDHGFDFFDEERVMRHGQQGKRVPQRWAMRIEQQPVFHSVETATHGVK